MLMMGALVTAAGLPGTLSERQAVPQWVESVSQVVGLVSLLLGVLAIVASIVRTDEAIEEIGARFRHLADHMGEGFVLASAEGSIVLVNPRFLEMTGLRESDILGANVGDLAGRLDGAAILPYLAQIARGQPAEFACSWNVYGEERHFLVNGLPLYNRRERLAGSLATVRDVTEQHNLSERLERYTHGLQQLVEDRTEKLRQSEERYRDLLLHMNEGFLTVDSSFRVRFANERICEVLALRPGSLVGRDLFDFVEGAGKARLLELLQRVDSGNDDPRQQEFVFLGEGGTPIPVMVAAALIRGEEAVPGEAAEPSSRYSLVITDVSELKRMQHQLEMRNNELQAANEELTMLDRAKDGFLSNVSHELKTPLTTVRGYIEMLESGSLGEMSEPQRSAVNVMARNVERLGLLIEEMIEFSKMEIRGLRLEIGLFRPRVLVQECVGSIRPQAAARNIRLLVEMDEEAAFAWADRKRVAQVISIFLSNAVKFSHPDGKIEVTVRARRDGALAVSVVDYGIGIPRAYRQRVFDKFFQVDSSRTRRYEGTGIGLSIAKTIAEAHGGRIELVSEAGLGSAFTLVLPRAVFNAAPPGPFPDELQGLRVLLAVARGEVRRVLAGVVERAGCVVSAVRNGHECVRAAYEFQPDVVVLGETLPDLTGLGVHQKLREEAAAPDAAVIVLASPGVDAPVGEFPGAEEPHILVKPFSAAEFLAKIQGAAFPEAFDEAREPAPVETGRPRRPRVLVVDSDPDMLAWLEMGLAKRRIDCVCARDVEEGLDRVGGLRPDAVLIDVDSADGAADDAVERLRDAEPTQGVPVYVITGAPLEYHHALGVAGGLRKPFALRDIEDIVLGPRVQSD